MAEAPAATPVEPPDPGLDAATELDEARMSFVEHLRELRTRLRNAVIFVILGFGVAYTFKQEILIWLLQPLLEVWARHPSLGEPSLYFGSLIDPFWGYFGLALWAGIFLASPLIFHQVWLFIAPGLYKKERRMGILFAGCSAICFVGGALFCYYLVLPAVYDFLLGFSTADLGEIQHELGVSYDVNADVGLAPLLGMREYVGFSRKLLIGFGLVFELPLAIFFMSLIGLVTHRGLWKFNRWWIVLSFVISAALTPPDVVSQILMAGPLVVLYNMSIGISFLVTRSRERKNAAIDAGD
jgi:sec-independent protein translocase protein TatC